MSKKLQLNIKIKEEEMGEFVGQIMDQIENYLAQDDDTVVLQGADYDQLAAAIQRVLKGWSE